MIDLGKPLYRAWFTRMRTVTDLFNIPVLVRDAAVQQIVNKLEVIEFFREMAEVVITT